jgi:hypothetical protein
MTMATKIFFVDASNEDGENLGAMVEATDVNDAINQWREWLKSFLCEDYDNDQPLSPDQVFQIPEKRGISGFFDWHTTDGVIEHDF